MLQSTSPLTKRRRNPRGQNTKNLPQPKKARLTFHEYQFNPETGKPIKASCTPSSRQSIVTTPQLDPLRDITNNREHTDTKKAPAGQQQQTLQNPQETEKLIPTKERIKRLNEQLDAVENQLMCYPENNILENLVEQIIENQRLLASQTGELFMTEVFCHLPETISMRALRKTQPLSFFKVIQQSQIVKECVQLMKLLYTQKNCFELALMHHNNIATCIESIKGVLNEISDLSQKNLIVEDISTSDSEEPTMEDISISDSKEPTMEDVSTSDSKEPAMEGVATAALKEKLEKITNEMDDIYHPLNNYLITFKSRLKALSTQMSNGVLSNYFEPGNVENWNAMWHDALNFQLQTIASPMQTDLPNKDYPTTPPVANEDCAPSFWHDALSFQLETIADPMQTDLPDQDNLATLPVTNEDCASSFPLSKMR